MTGTDLWALAREYDEQWPADTSNETVLMARLAVTADEQIDALRDELGHAIRTRNEWEANAEEAEADLAAARAEVADLRRWKDEAKTVLSRWDDVWEALGRPGELGRPKSEGVLAAVNELVGESCEARYSDGLFAISEEATDE